MELVAIPDIERYGASYLVDVSKEPFVFEELPGPNTIRESPSCGAFFMRNGDGEMVVESVIVMGGDHYVPPLSQNQGIFRLHSSFLKDQSNVLKKTFQK